MANGKEYDFLTLVNETPILIPQIQRDYIQYRDTHRVKTNRKRLIKKLCDCFTESNSLNLNFIYGYTVNDKKIDGKRHTVFVPIDGQQRLTTLYLFYFFIACCLGKEEELNGKLIYETRLSTNRFISKLPKLSLENKPSVTIRESGNYAAEWDLDPSVLSCLTILDEIQECFTKESFSRGSWNNLSNIKFMKLDIHGLTKPNELYIKMNSRGKQLSPFENFKSSLIGYIDEIKSEDLKRKVQALDNKWQNIIWDLWESTTLEEQVQKTDAFLKELFHWVIINRYCSLGQVESVPNLPDAEDCYLDDYSELFESTQQTSLLDALEDVFCTLEWLANLGKESFTYKAIKNHAFHIDATGFSLSSYPSRILLSCITKLSRSSDNNNYETTWRVLLNSVRCAEIDKEKDFCKALNKVQGFNISKVIDQGTFSDEKTIDFSSEKITLLEDRIKYQLIQKENDWKEAIYSAEEHDYFSGEIMFALKLCGIFSESDVQSADVNVFNATWEKIEKLFDPKAGDYAEYWIHRTLLHFGDYYSYGSKYGRDGFAQLCYRDTKHHNEDWRGMIRRDEGFEVFKAAFEAWDKPSETFEAFAKRICAQALPQSRITFSLNAGECRIPDDLISLLIRRKEMWEYIADYCRIYYWVSSTGDQYWYLMPTSTRGRYINYKLYELYLKLGKNKATYNESKSNNRNDNVKYGGKVITYRWKEKAEDIDGFYIDGTPQHTDDIEKAFNLL